MKTPSAIRRLSARSRAHREGGSALVAALVTLVVLALIAGSTFLTVTNRFRSNYQTASWHDALTSAEDGVQYAMVRLRYPLTQRDPNNTTQSGSGGLMNSILYSNQVLTDPMSVTNSLQADLNNSQDNQITTSVNGTLTITGTGENIHRTVQLPAISIPHSGDGSQVFSAVVTVDALPGTANVDNKNTSWYRIRSTGIVPLAGGAKVGIQKYDNFLRKLQFHKDGSGNTITKPQASRTIEVILKPIFVGDAALFAQTGINLNNQNVVIDSYNSTDPNASTGAVKQADGTYLYGQYDPSKATKMANVVSNDAPLGNGTPGVINLNNGGLCEWQHRDERYAGPRQHRSRLWLGHTRLLPESSQPARSQCNGRDVDAV